MTEINGHLGKPDRPATLQKDRPSSWAAVLAGLVIFVTGGLSAILGEIPHAWAVPDWVVYARGILLTLTLFLPAIGYALGWVEDFPRWSYPYVGLMIVLGLYLEHAATPGLHIFNLHLFGRDLWGWRAWIPFLIASGVALLITRSLRPLADLFTQAWEDWTRLTYALYGFMPLLVMVAFDEMDRLYSLRFMIILTLLMCGTALAYLRSRYPWQAVLSLLVGVTLSVAVIIVAPAVYWMTNGWGDVRGPLRAGSAVMGVMFSPALIGAIHHYVKPKQVVSS